MHTGGSQELVHNIPSFGKVGTGHLPLRGGGGLRPNIDPKASICQNACRKFSGTSFPHNQKARRQEHHKGVGVGVGTTSTAVLFRLGAGRDGKVLRNQQP